MDGVGGARRSRRSAPVAAAVAALLALTGCSGAVPVTLTPARPVAAPTTTPGSPSEPALPVDPPAGAPAPPVPDGVGAEDADLVALGEVMTQALASGDVGQWLSLFELDEEGTQQQRSWFAAVQQVPMQVREMHPTGRGEDGPGRGGRAADGEKVEFGFRHQVTGADPVPSVEYYTLTVARSDRDGRLRVTGVTGTSALRTAYPQLWDLRPVQVTQSEHLVVLADPAADELVAELLPALDEAADAVLAEVPVEGVERMVVTLTSPELLATLFGEAEVGHLAGFAAPLQGSPQVEEGEGLTDLAVRQDATVRLVLDQEYTADEVDRYGEDLAGGSPVLRHEGMHLAMMLTHVGASPPLWASEGLAGWFEVLGDDEPREDLAWWYDALLRGGGLPTELPPSLALAFHSDEGLAVDRHYAESAMLFGYVEEIYGYDATLALGAELHAIGLWEDEDELVDEALRQHLGVGLEQFLSDWLSWVAREFPEAGG